MDELSVFTALERSTLSWLAPTRLTTDTLVYQAFSQAFPAALWEPPQKRRSIDRHNGQAAELKQMFELIQINESHNEHRHSVQNSRATGSETGVISAPIMVCLQ